MLPDFPSTKRIVHDAHFRIMFKAMNAAQGIFSDVRVRPIKEGRQTAIRRPAGKVDDTKMHKFQVAETIPMSAVETWTDQQIVEHFEKMGREMGKKQVRATYEELNKVTQETGNVVNAEGTLTPDVFFVAIEKIWIEFDSDGKPRLPTMVIHPQQAEDWKRLNELMDADPANTRRMEKLMSRKKEEWRERESSRKLVD
jgi:hypothetical protein